MSLKSWKTVGIEAACPARHSPQRGRSGRSAARFSRVRQDGVGFAALLEFFLGVGIVRIAIGMKLQRQLAVRALDLLVAGFAGNSEHFVVIAFYVTGQNGPKSFRIS